MLTRGELVDLLKRTSWSDDVNRMKQADVILESYEVATKGLTAQRDALVADYLKAVAALDEVSKVNAELVLEVAALDEVSKVNAELVLEVAALGPKQDASKPAKK